MYRLLQGDVGSGKTIVALIAAIIVIDNGHQVGAARADGDPGRAALSDFVNLLTSSARDRRC